MKKLRDQAQFFIYHVGKYTYTLYYPENQEIRLNFNLHINEILTTVEKKRFNFESLQR